MLRRFFRFGELGANFHTEFIAGTTTFLAMAYIIMVNPAILSDAGMPKDALITATILASAFGTLLGGLWANVPYAMAPGMGINAFFAYTLVLGHNVTWQTALGVVFISGVFFLILTITGVRKMFVKAIPKHLRLGIAAGIGLFITFIGLQKLNIIVANKATMVGLGKVDMKVILGMVGLIVMMVLSVRKMRGAVLTGIVFTTLLGVLLGEVAKPSSWVAMPPSLAPLFLKLDIVAAFRWGLIGAIFSFMFVDLFDSIGSVVACAYEAGFVEKDGTIPHVQKILMAENGDKWLIGTTGPVEEVRNDEWHWFTVIARGNHLIQKLDDRLACEIFDHDPDKRALEGLLGVQLHAGPPMKVCVKDVWLKVLPEGGVLSPDETPLPADAQKMG